MNLKLIFEAIDQQQYECFGIDWTKRTDDQNLAYARQSCLALFQEVAELTDSFQFASWKAPEEPDVENITREVVDIIFFLHHICRCFGIDVSDLQERFTWVYRNNAEKYATGQRSDNHDY